MIRPLRGSELHDILRRYDNRPRPFPVLDRAFDSVERALDQLGIDDPETLRSPRPVEEALSDTALPDGTLLILSPHEVRAAEIDIEDTVKDERQGGSVFTTLPPKEELVGRARGLRELASAGAAFGFQIGSRPRVPSRLGKLNVVALPDLLAGYRFVMADTPGFRCCVVQRQMLSGSWITLWSGNDRILAELRTVLAAQAEAAGFPVPVCAPETPALEGIDTPKDVWNQARVLRGHRQARQTQLREIARQAALRGVALRREREAARLAALARTGT